MTKEHPDTIEPQRVIAAWGLAFLTVIVKVGVLCTLALMVVGAALVILSVIATVATTPKTHPQVKVDVCSVAYQTYLNTNIRSLPDSVRVAEGLTEEQLPVCPRYQ